jgi:AraC family transcriptional regulator
MADSGNRLDRVIEHIEVNLRQELNLTVLAGIAGVSPHHFAKLFKDSIGLTPHQFVIRQRIECAKDYLRNPKLSIGEISCLTGFATQEHFTKVFRRISGLTPREFRQGLNDREPFASVSNPKSKGVLR